LATCDGIGGGALGGAYKLVEYDGSPRLKLTAETIKSSLPGKKKILRLTDLSGHYGGDVICCMNDEPEAGERIFDPHNPARHKLLGTGSLDELHCLQMSAGSAVAPSPSLDQVADHAADELKRLPEGSLRLHNPHLYKVSISKSLCRLRDQLQHG